MKMLASSSFCLKANFKDLLLKGTEEPSASAALVGQGMH